jgi:hypothetical protein
MRFDDFLSTYSGELPELPLVHNTSCSQLEQILTTGILEPRDCSVFGEPLIYFFYGRPVYRSRKHGTSPDTRFDYCPVCLVFKPGALSSLARLLREAAAIVTR